MRKTLLTAAALTPLWFAAQGSAQTLTISSSQTTPVATATAVNSAPANVTITTGGSISPTTAVSPAITLNSNNSITHQGSIQFTGLDSATGVLIQGGNTGSFTNSGSISVTTSYSASDTNSDGVNEAPFATGTDRRGILVRGTSPFVGAINNASGSSVAVKGNNSYAVSIESDVTGSLTQAGSLSLIGDNGAALTTSGKVSGPVLVTGVVSAQGKSSDAIRLLGDVGGRVSVYSSLNSSGYGTTTRPTTTTTLNTVQATATEVQQGGSALIIGGNVGAGVYLGAAPSGTTSGSTSDVDGDGVADGSQGTAGLTTFGSAPALVVGAAGRSITLSPLSLTVSTPYSLAIAGAVTGSGVYDGVTATGAQFGVNGGNVTFAGGAKVSGTISASSHGADATGLRVQSGTTLPVLEITGQVGASIDQPGLTNNAVTPYTATATALLINSGATLSTVTNSGTIASAIAGDTAAASAIVDRSGSLTTLNNSGKIGASVTAATSGSTATGATTALDLRANTLGFTLNQTQAPNVTATDSSGKSTTTTPASPTMIGDIWLGNGPNTLNLRSGSVTGALSLGNGASSILLDGGAIYTGSLTYGGTALGITVTNGTLTNTSASTIKASSLTLGSKGVLGFDVDPVNGTATKIIVNGPATLASGAKLSVNLRSNITSAQTYTLIQASSLTSAASDLTLLSSLPYLLYGSTVTTPSAGTISLVVRPRTALEMGLNRSQASFLTPFYNSLTGDSTVQSSFLAQTNRNDFLRLYNQVLPEYAGGTFQALRQSAQAIGRATGTQNGVPLDGRALNAWGQQIYFGVNQDSGQTNGFRGRGFGFATGIDSHTDGFGVLGLSAGLVSTTIRDPNVPSDSPTTATHLEGGAYWQGSMGRFVVDLRGAAGYIWYKDRRQFIATNSSGATYLRSAPSSTRGYSLTGHAGVTYETKLSKAIYVRPSVSLDYFRATEGAWSNSSGGNAIALSVNKRVGDAASATANVTLGGTFGHDTLWRPELDLGYRNTVSGTAGDTRGRFKASGASFTLTPQDIKGGAALTRLRLRAVNPYYELAFEAGGEVQSGYKAADLAAKLSIRF